MARTYKQQTNVASYAIPAIFALIVILILGNIFFGGETVTPANETNNNFVYVHENDENDTISLIHEDKKRTTVQGEQKVFPKEQIHVQSGDADLELPGQVGTIKLDSGAKIVYIGGSNDKQRFELSNAKAWIEDVTTNTEITLANFVASIDARSTVYLFQNSVASTIAVAHGTARAENEDTLVILGKGEKLTVQNSETLNQNQKVTIEENDVLFSDNWFLKNNGDNLLSTSKTTENTPTEISTSTPNGKTITVISPRDESVISGDENTISGTITDIRVSKITVDGVVADIDENEWSFIAQNVSTNKSTNELIIKIYDDENDLLGKEVLTLYNNNGTDEESAVVNTTKTPTVQTYNLPTSSYKILAPQTLNGVHYTTEGVVRIDGAVPAGTVGKILVNGFRLTKFPSGGSNWYYFANEDYNNLNNGANLYNIEYFDLDGNLLYSHALFIIKTNGAVASSEATIQ